MRLLPAARHLVPDPERLIDSAATAWDLYAGAGVADLRRTPSSIVHEAPQCIVRRYRSPRREQRAGTPVLLVPPLAAPASCFDLRRGCSLAEHLTSLGYPTYVVDYGPISFGDRALGLEHWVDEVLPTAIGVVTHDAGGAPVQLVGWSLGGIVAMLAVAAHAALPVASVALVGSPFDFTRVRLAAPLRQLERLTGGALVTALYRLLGGAPAPLVSRGFQITSFDRYLTKPLWRLRNLQDREAIAHSEAVDAYMANMLAYPGRSFGQLYHRFFLVNELAGGTATIDDDRVVDLADVRQPVLALAGTSDALAPVAAVRAVADLLPNAASVRFEEVPGSHLGMLTGSSAASTTWRHLDEFLAGCARRAPAAPRAHPRPRSRPPAARAPADGAATSSSAP
jgi:polyhydroxyalkanoate synthase subunit PhaC